MDEEIDIEEHDVLDNPAIKQMFPDISKLKKEFQIYYSDDDSDMEIVSVQPSSKDTAGSNQSDSANITGTSAIISQVHNEGTYSQSQHINSILCDITVTVEDTSDELDIKDLSLEVPMHTNRIILGSKPSTLKNVLEYERFFEKQLKFNQPKVKLDDLQSYLESSKRFCNTCQILFPSCTDLQAHDLHVHINAGRGSPIVPVARYECKKSNISIKKSRNSEGKIYSCPKCQLTYTVSSSLTRHKRNAHGIEKAGTNARIRSINTVSKSEVIIKKRIMDRVRQKLKNRKDLASNFRNQCYHCKKNFPDQLSLIEHIYTILQKKNIKCKICSRKFLDQENLNKHMHTNHKEVKSKEIIGEENSTSHPSIKPKSSKLKDCVKLTNDDCLNTLLFYKCPICYQYYEKRHPFIYHMNKRHNIFKTLQYVTKTNKFDPKCNFCSAVCNKGVRFLNTHIRVRHQVHYCTVKKVTQSRKKVNLEKADLSVANTSENFTETNDNVQSEVLVLNGIIFKCNKCDVHFLSSNTCLNHTEHMEMLINWKCDSCLRIFKKEDSQKHEIQHLYGDEFTVTDLSGLSVSRVLYSCPNCAIHFTEAMLAYHHSRCGNEVARSTYCKICDILIDDTIGPFHQSSHTQEHLGKSDFAIINADYCYKKKTVASVGEKTVHCLPLGQLHNNDEFSMYYCKKCKCYLGSGAHSLSFGYCENNKKTRFCSKCGLQLSRYAYKIHRRLHSKYKKLSLQHMKFYDMDGMQICPSLPDFRKCSSCDVHVLNYFDSHKCEQGNSTCNLCNIKLSKKAFKIHMTYHDYALHERTKYIVLKEIKKEKPVKYISLDEGATSNESHDNEPMNVVIETPRDTSGQHGLVSEILVFHCNNCNICVDSYDHTIEHCQEHYSRNSSQQVPIECRLCNLLFDINYYRCHTEQHSSKQENIVFKTIKFDVTYFTSENAIWTQHVFKTCTAKQKDDILEESIYKFESRIKMRITQDGPANLTVYKCDKCDCFIDGLSLNRHAENSCFKVRKHPCTKCGIPFISSVSRMEHEQIHVNLTVDLKSYRIVTFNKVEDEQFNSQMYSQKHYVIYQCRNCNSSCDRSQVNRHVCYSKVEKCRMCGILIPLEQYDSHKSKHKDLIRFTENNIKVILFGDKLTTSASSFNTLFPSFKGIVVDYTFYQCSNCSLCVKSTLGISKHECLFKSAKSICLHCNLAFPMAKLKNHRKLHETDQDFIKENMKIISFRPQEREKLQCPSTSTNYANVEIVIEDSSNESEESVFEEESDSAVLHRCRCGVHFLCETSAKQHSRKCNPKTKRPGHRCAKCGLLFQPTILFEHLLKHHGNKNKEFKYDIVDVNDHTDINVLHAEAIPESLVADNVELSEKEVTMGKLTYNYNSTLYKCKECGVHYLCKDTIKDHLNEGHIISARHDNCNICGLKISSGSVAKHMYIHHELLHLSLKDLIVEEVDKM